MQAIPHMLAGDVKGTANHTYIGGWDPRNGANYVYYEYPHGGVGGFLGGDGSHTIACYNSGDCSSIQPVESLEMEYPFLIERTELRKNSCGDGKWRGGLGLRRDVRLMLSDGYLSVVSDRNVIPPFGIAGALSGYANRFVVNRGGQLVEPSPMAGKVTNFHMLKDDVLIEMSNGGGGYGDPLERDPQLVLQDVREELISPERAKDNYGVVITNGALDPGETARLRQMLRSRQKSFAVRDAKREEYPQGRRVCRLSVSDCRELGLQEGQLVEYLGRNGVPLRAWVVCGDDVPPDEVELGAVGRKILNITVGDPVSIRRVETVAATSSPDGRQTNGQPE